MPSRDLLEVSHARPVVRDGEVLRGLHHVRGGLAVVAELARGEPWVLPQCDPVRVDPVGAGGVGDPFGDHDGDHDGEDV